MTQNENVVVTHTDIDTMTNYVLESYAPGEFWYDSFFKDYEAITYDEVYDVVKTILFPLQIKRHGQISFCTPQRHFVRDVLLFNRGKDPKDLECGLMIMKELQNKQFTKEEIYEQWAYEELKDFVFYEKLGSIDELTEDRIKQIRADLWKRVTEGGWLDIAYEDLKKQ